VLAVALPLAIGGATGMSRHQFPLFFIDGFEVVTEILCWTWNREHQSTKMINFENQSVGG